MKATLQGLLLWVCLLSSLATKSTQAAELPQIQVSDNRRFLVTDKGKPFFWLGDTAWSLFERLNREDADFYLSDRQSKGFTVIQAVLLFEGGIKPNAYGHRQFVKDKQGKWTPNESYFKQGDILTIADEVECLMDLHEARLESQALELLDHLFLKTKTMQLVLQ